MTARRRTGCQDNVVLLELLDVGLALLTVPEVDLSGVSRSDVGAQEAVLLAQMKTMTGLKRTLNTSVYLAISLRHFHRQPTSSHSSAYLYDGDRRRDDERVLALLGRGRGVEVGQEERDGLHRFAHAHLQRQRRLYFRQRTSSARMPPFHGPASCLSSQLRPSSWKGSSLSVRPSGCADFSG